VIDRRMCVGGVALGFVAAPLAAKAQPSGRVLRVGVAASIAPLSALVGPEPAEPTFRAFVQGLRALGHVEGQNLILERRSAEGRPERFGDIVAELVALGSDVILTGNDRMTRAAKAVTSTVPIVMVISADPGGTGATYVDRAVIVDFATRTRLPSSFDIREAVEIGGLMSYGVNLADNYRRAAGYVDKILKGAKPADLPVEQPTKFELVVNAKTAQALGTKIPQSLLLRADEVIQ